MKKIFTLLLFLSVSFFQQQELIAQVPQAINYQAIARNVNGTLIENTALGVRASIYLGSPSGPIQCAETFQVNTNLYGLFTIQIGRGTPLIGDFTTIPWNTGSFWLKIELDLLNTGNYVLLGTSEMLTVPYAMYAANGAPGPPGPFGPTGPAGPPGPQAPWTEIAGTYTTPSTLICGTNGTACGSPVVHLAGTGTTTSASTTLSTITPFKGFWTNGRSQYLFTAAELTAAGMTSGTIASIELNVTSVNSTQAYNGFSVRTKCTSATSLSAFEAGATLNYGPINYTPSVGWNTFNFGSTFDWDGTSNLIVEFCFSNGINNWTLSDQVEYTATSFVSNYYGYHDSSTPSPCDFIAWGIEGSLSNRPNIRFNSCNAIPLPPTPGNYMSYSDGLVVGVPTGGYLGPGKINAQAIYDDNVVLTDYVFDHYFDKKLKAQDVEKHSDFSMMSISDMREFIQKERHLPSIKGRSDWDKKGRFSVGELSQQLWETVEIQAIYITQLEERISKIENSIATKQANHQKKHKSEKSPKEKKSSPMTYDELKAKSNSVMNSTELSQDEKEAKILRLKSSFQKM